ncbi:ATP-binding protein [Nonomuraea lactucae]|uniref:ATP-binding protein n=1 Tax=Nonomuraea lactucae TaxID=2249762 RepID=UPI000DE2A560|nr:ATP-binding protein [Nonomuraea lactucae]
MDIRSRKEEASTITFTEGDVAGARSAVERFAERQGMSPERVTDLVLAANEAVVNAVAYGGGRGVVRVWSDRGSVFCDVRDFGPGIPLDRLNRGHPPRYELAGGWGIWLIRRLADKVAFTTGPGGTAVRIAMTLSDHERAVS